MLWVNLRHLEARAIRLQGELPAAEMDFCVHDEMIRAERPVFYDFTAEKLRNGLLLSGTLRLVLDCVCVRCLTPFEYELVLAGWKCHLPFSGEDRVRVENDGVDLTPFVREDILLEFPRHPLCRPDCAGLKTGQGRKPAREVFQPPVWAELNKLKW